jgi:hypothetical protein
MRFIDHLAMDAPRIPKPADICIDNTIHVDFDELFEKHEKAYEDVKVKHQEELNFPCKKQEDELQALRRRRRKMKVRRHL